MTMTDRLFNILHACNSKSSTSFDPEPPIPNLEKDPPEAEEMTAAEISNFSMHIRLTKLIYHLISEELPSSEELRSSISSVQEWLSETAERYTSASGVTPLYATAYSANITIPNWQFLHWSFATLDTLKAVTLLLNFASKPQKSQSKLTSPARIPAEKITELRASTTKIYDSIRSSAKALKEKLSTGILEEFLNLLLERQEDGDSDGDAQGSIGKKIEQVLETTGGESWLEMWCGGMRNAWDEAIDGFLAVKL
jgi:N-terminal acetyltransferase B complex non-catalytic subunit